ncbi:L,D-transpeptidase family protein [Rhizobium sp. RCAM05350]|nr:L,D-transpeptidase family protein [Rhizobium sp. RCAM05350]
MTAIRSLPRRMFRRAKPVIRHQQAFSRSWKNAGFTSRTSIQNAPMPFMQRLTWSGIALHASNHVPSYPASHGCVRMPDAFAKQLFKMTSRGLHVLISDRQLTPVAISDPFLFQPKAEEPELLSDATLRPERFARSHPVRRSRHDRAPTGKTGPRRNGKATADPDADHPSRPA